MIEAGKVIQIQKGTGSQLTRRANSSSYGVRSCTNGAQSQYPKGFCCYYEPVDASTFPSVLNIQLGCEISL